MNDILPSTEIENLIKDKIFKIQERANKTLNENHKKALNETAHTTITKIINNHKESLHMILQIVESIDEHDISHRYHDKNNNFEFSIQLLKKIPFNVRKVGAIAFSCFQNRPIRPDNSDIDAKEYTIELNEEAVLLLENILGTEKIISILNCTTPGGNYFKRTAQRERCLFLMGNHKIEKINHIFTPVNIIKEIRTKIGDDELKNNRQVLAEYLMEAQRDFIKSNYEAIVNNKTTLSKDNIFSFQNIIEYLFDSHNTNNKEKFAEVIKRMQRNDIINIDINDYTFILKYVLQKYGIKDLNCLEKIEMNIRNENNEFNRYRDGLLTLLMTNYRLYGLFSMPKEYDKYQEDFFSTNKKEFLKSFFNFGKEKIFESNASTDEYLVMNKIHKSLPRHLSQLDCITNMLEVFHNIQSENKKDIYGELKKIWNNIYNWPFEIQNNFYSISKLLLEYDTESYYVFLKGLNQLSKKDRKHFVQLDSQSLETAINFIKFIDFKTPRQEKVEIQTEAWRVREIIQDTINELKNQKNTQELEAIMNKNLEKFKKAFFKDNFLIDDSEKYTATDNKDTDIFLTYWNNLSKKDEINIGKIGLMIMLHHHKLRNKRRVDKTIDIPDFSLEGKEKMKDFLNDNEKKYRKKYIESEKLEELQQDVSIESTIHPQTYAEKIFDIQEAFEEMRDPDIYENEEAKDTAKKIYRKKNKCNILKSYDREKMHATLPISNFTERIEALKLSSLHKKLTKRESNTNKEDEDLILTEYTVTLKEAIYIFQEIVKAYENKGMPDVAQIRIEDIATNFSLEVDELSRQTTLLEEDNKDTLIVSRITNNMMDIIPTIRGCISCMQKNGSNYTNLGFTNPNRFLMMTDKQEEVGQKNISDQICILLPTDKGVCFVLDRVYGAHTPKIMINNCLCVLKKIADTKKNIKLFIPNDSIKSVGITVNNFLIEIKKTMEERGLETEIGFNTIQPEKTYLGYQECLNGEYTHGIMISYKQ